MTLLKNKNKTVFALLGAVLALAILISAVCFFVYMSENYRLGVVTKFSVKQKAADTMEFRIQYLLPSGGYSVRVVSEEEGEYVGDGMIDYDGAIGKYRILVQFGDVDLAKSFANKMDENGVIVLSEDIRASVATPADHGFVLYIGSDKPISVEFLENGKLNSLGGTIKIPITIENQ